MCSTGFLVLSILVDIFHVERSERSSRVGCFNWRFFWISFSGIY